MMRLVSLYEEVASWPSQCHVRVQRKADHPQMTLNLIVS